MEQYKPISPKAARVNARISTTKAAEQLGISRATLSSYEAGRTSPPWEIVEKMGNLYDWPITAISFARQSTKSGVEETK